MECQPPAGPVVAAIESVVHPDGYRIVECAVKTVRRRTQVHCVLFHPEGIRLDALGEIHARLVPMIETAIGEDGPHVEFSSPGIERVLKNCYEFGVFQGAAARILIADDGTWIQGTIVGLDSCTVSLKTGADSIREIPCGAIQKAQLQDEGGA